MNIMQQPYFLNNGGNRKAKDGIMLWYAGKNPYISSITCTDTITIHSTYNGVPTTETYSDLSNVAIAIKADPNTEVYVEGEIKTIGGVDISLSKMVCNNTQLSSLKCDYCTELKELNLSNNTNLSSLSCNNCTGLKELNLPAQLSSLQCDYCTELKELNLSNNTNLSSLSCNNCTGLKELNLSNNTNLSSLSCNNCTGLKELNLSSNNTIGVYTTDCTELLKLNLENCPKLQSLNCGNCISMIELNISTCNAIYQSCYMIGCINLIYIYANASRSEIANYLATLISSTISTTGTLYINSSDEYASTVTSAATAKGWTVKELPAA